MYPDMSIFMSTMNTDIGTMNTDIGTIGTMYTDVSVTMGGLRLN